MLEEEKVYWDSMDEDTKTLCENTINELKSKLKIENIGLLDEIDLDTVKSICEAESVSIDEAVIDEVKTPFALARYLRIMNDLSLVREKVKNDLTAIFKDNEDKFDWYVSGSFNTRIINITKKRDVNDESKIQSLDLTYRYDQDNDVIVYGLRGASWGWDISKEELKIILGITTASNILPVQTSTKQVNKNSVKLDLGDIEITVNRK